MAKYPKIGIRSDRELVKRLSSKHIEESEVNSLIKICRHDKDDFWRDNLKESKPEEEKYVRSTLGPLRRFLKLLDKKILKRYDDMLPCHIFARKGKSHLDAAIKLLGRGKGRVFLSVDLRRFFESVSQQKIVGIFIRQFCCSAKFSKFFAKMVCVNSGPKGSLNSSPVLARGFPTSSRVAVWCNLSFFLALNKLVKKRLKGRDPKIACYVDDIGVTASRTSKDEMEKLFLEIKRLAENHGLKVNTNKKKIFEGNQIKEFLGLKLNRKTIEATHETKIKEIVLCKKLGTTSDPAEREHLLRKIKGLRQYKKTIKVKNEQFSTSTQPALRLISRSARGTVNS